MIVGEVWAMSKRSGTKQREKSKGREETETLQKAMTFSGEQNKTQVLPFFSKKWRGGACHEIGTGNSQSGSKYCHGMTRAQIPGSARNNAAHCRWSWRSRHQGHTEVLKKSAKRRERKKRSLSWASSTLLVRAWIRQHPTKKAGAGDNPAAECTSGGSDRVC